MKVHCLKPKNTILNKYIGHYLVTAIKKSIQESSYADQISSTTLPSMDIILPITPCREPDWLSMEEYMQNIELRVVNACGTLGIFFIELHLFSPLNIAK